MVLVVDPRGALRCLYTEVIDLAALGALRIVRASHVEPDAAGRWWADLGPAGGPRLGPFGRRSGALAAEAAWIEVHRLGLSVDPDPNGT
jgi:hypothetical protein